MFKRQSSPEPSTASVSSIDSTEAEKLKAIKDAEKQERKKKALISVTKLLNMSEKYSSMWQDRFKNIKINQNQINETEMVYMDADLKMKYFQGELRPYQVEGVKWMQTLYMGGINGILADEMGLGKTVQIIALFSLLLQNKVAGPHLVVVPLSTMRNWENEFKRFAPTFPIIVFQGNAELRAELKRNVLRKHNVNGMKLPPVVLTAYHTALSEVNFFSSIRWKYIVVDEAQRIKNHQSQLAVALRTIKCDNKMLLTGTPLQNNMTELWALLNYIMPNIFKNLDAFSSLFILEDMEDDNIRNDHKENSTIVSTIHKVLAPFMLRRLKKDVLGDIVPKKELIVYCPMTKTQLDLYSYIVQKNMKKIKKEEEEEVIDFDAPRVKRKCTMKTSYDVITLSDDDSDEEEGFRVRRIYSPGLTKEEKERIFLRKRSYYYNIKMQNTMMMFRKVVDHPFLISMPIIPNTREILIDETLVTESGKMQVLDAMLHKLKAKGHKVLIFSTLCILLDLIEDFMIMRKLKYCRLDGARSLDNRQANIDEFNSNPNVLAFLISTRAGGLGLNLVAADTVIFYDRDWNPQVDIQAQDRCHRIGQTRPVMVYTLVSKNTIDEKIIDTGDKKKRLEKLIIKDGKFQTAKEIQELFDPDELDRLFAFNKNNRIHPNGFIFSDRELNKLLDRSDLIKQMENLNTPLKKEVRVKEE